MADPFLGQIMAVPYTFAPDQWSLCQGQQLQMSQFQALFSLLAYNFGGNNSTIFNLPDLRGRVIVGAGTPVGISGLTTLNPGNTGGTAQHTLTMTEVPLPAHTHGATFTGTGGGGGGGGSQTASGTVSLPITGTCSASATVNGSLQATTNNGQQWVPQAGWTLGDAGGASIYAPGTSGSEVNLAPITSTGSVSGTVTGTASGPVSLTVSGGGGGGITGGTVTVQPAGQNAAQAVSLMPPFLAMNTIIAMVGIYPTRG